jgi:tRNA (guanine-N7-)-methyltransferase
VRRTRRLPLEELQSYLLQFSPLLNLPALFGNDHPVELEVGFGKGLFLLNAAEAHPRINYLGIEIERAYQLYTATRLAKRRLTNVRLACGDARLFVRDQLPDQCLQALHIYFPDPWWKTRHRKRRLFNEEFTRQCGRVLRLGGRLHVATDVAEYFEGIQKLVARQPHLRLLPDQEPAQPSHDFDYLTNFERKYRKEARPIHRASYQRER